MKKLRILCLNECWTICKYLQMSEYLNLKSILMEQDWWSCTFQRLNEFVNVVVNEWKSCSLQEMVECVRSIRNTLLFPTWIFHLFHTMCHDITFSKLNSPKEFHFTLNKNNLFEVYRFGPTDRCYQIHSVHIVGIFQNTSLKFQFSRWHFSKVERFIYRNFRQNSRLWICFK